MAIDPNDAQTVNFHYPAAFATSEYAGMSYITPRVKLELGARGDPWPTEEKVIRPYAAEDYPAIFADADTTVRVLSARRTFWEIRTAALEVVRNLITRVMVLGSPGGLALELEGALTAMIGLAQNDKSPLGSGLDCLSVDIVR